MSTDSLTGYPGHVTLTLSGEEAGAYTGDDITLYSETGKEKSLVSAPPLHALLTVPPDQKSEGAFSRSCDLTLRISSEADNSPVTEGSGPPTYRGRALIASCFRRRYASTTVRLDGKGIEFEKPYITERFTSSFSSKGKVSKEWPIPIEATVRYVMGLIRDDVPKGGMIFVSGATGSGKTQIANGLIHELAALARGHTSRCRPHILTVEDHIEKFMFETPDAARDQGVDYTPRQVRLDTPSVEWALKDALRQKPAVVSLGEVRANADMVAMSAFARTGHLVMATTHAGSLVEAMDKLFQVNNADRPARRGQVAGALLACIHLRVHVFDGPPQGDKWNVCYPTIWRRTPTGIAEIVSDGLAALLPNCSPPSATPPGRSSFGRLHFVDTVLDKEQSEPGNPLTKSLRAEIQEALETEAAGKRPHHFRAAAAEWDIEGMTGRCVGS